MAEVRKNEAQGRYEVLKDGQVVGFAEYSQQGNVVTMPHTEVDEAHEGEGLGGQLAEFALNDIRAAGQQVRPSCAFIRHYIEEHSEYAGLVAQ